MPGDVVVHTLRGIVNRGLSFRLISYIVCQSISLIHLMLDENSTYLKWPKIPPKHLPSQYYWVCVTELGAHGMQVK